MGYDTARFNGEVDEELICPICTGVLEDPVQAEKCEHSFCRGCISDWLTKHSSCPIDRGELTKRQLKPVPRILKNLLSRLQMHCDFREEGCEDWIKLDVLDSHLKVCDSNPRKPVQCDKGCRLMHLKCEGESHDCIKALRDLLDETKQKHQELEDGYEEENAMLTRRVSELQHKVHTLQESLYSSSSSRAASPSPPQPAENSWLRELSVAKVSRWGGLISTPDTVLQTFTKKALLKCGCPLHTANLLVACSHERVWPPGLKTLEARQLNRRMYKTYVTRRIPGKQAVVVMACENAHMADDFMLEPGLLFVFAQGVE